MFWTAWRKKANLLESELNDILCLDYWWYRRKDAATVGKKSYKKSKFTKIEKYATEFDWFSYLRVAVRLV